MKQSRVLATTLQIGYWLMYVVLLLLFFLLLNAQKLPAPSLHNYASWGILMLIIAIIPGAIAFYAAYLLVFERFLQAKKIKQLIAAAVVVSILSALVGSFLATIVIDSSFWTVDGYSGAVFVLSILSLIALVNFVMGLVIKGFTAWFEELHVKEELNKRNYEMELSLIKSQLDPHFLFNTINNIDVLITRDSEKASLYLNRLSEMMRYMLYETKTSKISLKDELSYIEKYIGLQKIRTVRPESILYSVDTNAEGWMIEPMLYIPFIENAFKHFSKDGIIDVRFVILSHSVQFTCTNSFEPIIENKKSLGLGKELIERRLALLYQNRYELETKTEYNTYIVKLTIFR